MLFDILMKYLLSLLLSSNRIFMWNNVTQSNEILVYKVNAASRRLEVFVEFPKMIHLMATLRGLLKPQSVHIDNIFFCLHYRLTLIFLLTFSVLVGSRQYFREPLNCEFSEYPNGDLNNYCFVQATFVREQSGKSRGRMRFYSYYSWVSLALLVQAVFFYLPRYMWKALEGERIKVLLCMEVHSLTLKKDCIEKESEELCEYFRVHLQTHNLYAYRYFFCELLNLINIGGQIIFLNR